MTRINADIPPKYLSDHHLIAEQKEILRIPRLFKQKKENGSLKKTIFPVNFTLGEGHIMFFINHGKFCYSRYWDLCEEMNNRKLDYQSYLFIFDPFMGTDYNNPWKASRSDRILVINRIIDKMTQKMLIRSNYGVSYMGEKEPVAETIKRLLKSLK